MGENNFVSILQKNLLNSKGKKFHFLSDDLEIQSSLTYAEIDSRARTVAAFMHARGVHPKDRAILLYPPGLDFIVSFVVCFYSGVIAVPLYPPFTPFLRERLEKVIESAEPKIILSTDKIINRLKILQWTQSLKKFSWLKQLSRSFSGSSEALQIKKHSSLLWGNTDKLTSFSSKGYQLYNPSGGEIAFLQYTSGSTGNPKGVMISHRNLVSNANIIETCLHLDEESIGFCWVPPYHDLGLIGNILQALYSNTRLYLLSPFDSIKNPLLWVKGISRYRATHSSGPNFAFALTCSHRDKIDPATLDLSSWQVAHCGEPLPSMVVKKAATCFPESIKLYNLYGPSEATVDVSFFPVTSEEKFNNFVSIARPIANIQLYIVDKNLNRVPIGVPGELLIGGVGLARGYLNHPELTQEKFIKNPFSPHPEDRVYRTGDLCRYLEDGNIEYLARIDFQVKLRGFRIELGEVEFNLLRLEGVEAAAVVAHDFSETEKRLVVYVVPSNAGKVLYPGEAQARWFTRLREQLREQLLDYMIPSHFIVLTELLLTSSGKVSRKALPDPDPNIRSLDKYVAPKTKLELQLASIWSNLLHVDKVGIHDNFFELGGHSLEAMILINTINKALKTKLQVHDILLYPTICMMVEKIKEKI